AQYQNYSPVGSPDHQMQSPGHRAVVRVRVQPVSPQRHPAQSPHRSGYSPEPDALNRAKTAKPVTTPESAAAPAAQAQQLRDAHVSVAADAAARPDQDSRQSESSTTQRDSTPVSQRQR